MTASAFQRRVEDFVCERCGTSVIGSGYTNHCPACLWSKHVDVEPGDRSEECGGMMKPIRIEGGTPNYVIVHQCERCGMKKRNVVSEQDDMSAVAAIAKMSA